MSRLHVAPAGARRSQHSIKQENARTRYAGQPSPGARLPLPSGEPPKEFACARCGSTALTRDAWAGWDIEKQAWVLREVFDFFFCHDCHRETQAIERPAGAEQ